MANPKSKKAPAAAAKATKKDAVHDEPKAVATASKPRAENAKNPLADDGSDSDDEITELKVNAKFAKEYMDRKRKEELTNLERQRAYLEDDDDDESESETEDEDAEELTEELDNDIKKTLRLIRKRDPIIYDKSVTFFKAAEDDDGDDSDGSDDGKRKKKQKQKTDAPLYYKDLVRQQVIAEDMASDEEDEADNARVMTYGEEQAQLKADFMKTLKQATKGDDDENDGEDEGSDLEGGLFSIRTKSESEKQQDDEDYAAFQSKYGTKLKKDTIDPEAFLENYLNGGWRDKKDVIPHYEDIVNDDEEDAEELERMEEFEHAYNFRFEEEGSGLIQTYSRNIDDTLRRKDDSRKRKREERKERKALERLKKEEELKRLKNLKQAEIQSKLDKIAKLVGKVSSEDRMQEVLKADLDGDFDPEEYDKRMKQIFDDEYYNEDGDEIEEKPTWDDEEDKALFADLPVEDEEEEEEGAEQQEEEEQGEEDEDDEEEGGDEDADTDDNEDEEMDVDNMTPEELQRAKQKYLDELYSLDYEDLIGDIKCRFKYRQVRQNDFGLTAEEIMAADDKELKQLVSLKRIAPYVEQEYSVHRKQIKNFKKSLEEKRAEEAAKTRKGKKAADGKKGGDVDQPPVEDAPTKKRKRNKKNKNAASDAGTVSVGAEEAAVTEEDDQNKSADESSTPKPAKKARRSGKKKKNKNNSSESNAYASTGLSSSRLESYKLLKSKK